MLGRPENLEQLFLAEFNQKKIYCSQTSLKESKRLEQEAKGIKEEMQWLQPTMGIKLSALNIRSLKAHFTDLLNDSVMLSSDIIALSETFLPAIGNFAPPKIPGFEDFHVMAGKGNK